MISTNTNSNNERERSHLKGSERWRDLRENRVLYALENRFLIATTYSLLVLAAKSGRGAVFHWIVRTL